MILQDDGIHSTKIKFILEKFNVKSGDKFEKISKNISIITKGNNITRNDKIER